MILFQKNNYRINFWFMTKIQAVLKTLIKLEKWGNCYYEKKITEDSNNTTKTMVGTIKDRVNCIEGQSCYKKIEKGNNKWYLTNAERGLYGEENTKKEKRQKVDIAICLKREEKNISQHKKNKPFGVFPKDLQQQVE